MYTHIYSHKIGVGLSSYCKRECTKLFYLMHPQAASLCKKSLVISYTNTLHPTCNLLTRKKQLSHN